MIVIIEYDLEQLICPKINMANSAEICHDKYPGHIFGTLAECGPHGSVQFPTVPGQDVE